MVIRLEPGEGAPWHTHEGSCETAWVISGKGTLVTREPSEKPSGAISRDAAKPGRAWREESHPLGNETAILIPAGLLHMVENDGTEPLVIFAIHSTIGSGTTGSGTTGSGTQQVFTQEGTGNE